MTDIAWVDLGGGAPVVDRLVATFNHNPTARIAISGSLTPRPILAMLAERWQPVWRPFVLLVDERLTPLGHAASNYRMVADALSATTARVLPLTPGPSAGVFDLVWVGMGTDGHVASIFPGAPINPHAPPAVVHVVPDPLPPEAPFERLTLTYAALVSTRVLLVVARGQDKRALLEEAVRGNRTLPIGELLAQARCPVVIYWAA